MPDRGRLFCQARRFGAGILADFKSNQRSPGEKKILQDGVLEVLKQTLGRRDHMNFNFTSDQYGEKYKDHLIEMYKLYVEMADRVSQRRMDTNSFFLSANTLLVGFITLFYSFSNDKYLLCIASTAVGIILCGAWFYLLQSYRKLNSGKFKVIHQLEALLPVSLYELEWNILGKGNRRKLYWPLSHMEVILPIIFATVYIVLLIYFLYSCSSLVTS